MIMKMTEEESAKLKAAEEIALREIKEIGLSPGKYTIKKRSNHGKNLGLCELLRDGTYRITIQRLILDGHFWLLLSVVAHEILHTCSKEDDYMYHESEFAAAGDKLNRKGIYAGTVWFSRFIDDPGRIKRFFVCPCGFWLPYDQDGRNETGCSMCRRLISTCGEFAYCGDQKLETVRFKPYPTPTISF